MKTAMPLPLCPSACAPWARVGFPISERARARVCVSEREREKERDFHRQWQQYNAVRLMNAGKIL